MSNIYKFKFLLIPSITAIEFDFKFKTLRYLFRDKSIIFVMLLLLTSKKSKCKGAYFTSNIEVSSLFAAFTFMRYRKPDRYFKDFSLL